MARCKFDGSVGVTVGWVVQAWQMAVCLRAVGHHNRAKVTERDREPVAMPAEVPDRHTGRVSVGHAPVDRFAGACHAEEPSVRVQIAPPGHAALGTEGDDRSGEGSVCRTGIERGDPRCSTLLGDLDVELLVGQHNGFQRRTWAPHEPPHLDQGTASRRRGWPGDAAQQIARGVAGRSATSAEQPRGGARGQCSIVLTEARAVVRDDMA